MMRVTPVISAFYVLALGACPATSEQVRPPDDRIFFPTNITMSPDGEVLFVVNANSDLRYDSGTISLIDLDEVSDLAANWIDSGTAPEGRDCEPDSVIPYTLVCQEDEVILADSTVRIGNFATEVQVQTLDDGKYRLFAAVRGDPSVTWIDYDADKRELSCGGSGDYPRCNDAHRLVRMRGDAAIGDLPDEPFGIYVDSQGGFVVVTHLIFGAVSLVDAPSDGAAPLLVDALGGVFQADPNTGVSGAVGAAGRQPGTPGDRVYVTSRTEARVQLFTVARVGGLSQLVPAEFFFLRGVTPSDDARGIKFGRGGDRAYVVNRDPPVLQVLDTSLDEFGLPANELRQGIELCREAANLDVADLGQGERVWVACFRNGQVWRIDPEGGVVQSIIDVGRGPQAVVVDEVRQKLYVTNFLEDTIVVIDLEPGSVTENRVVLRLGRTRQSGD